MLLNIGAGYAFNCTEIVKLPDEIYPFVFVAFGYFQLLRFHNLFRPLILNYVAGFKELGNPRNCDRAVVEKDQFSPLPPNLCIFPFMLKK